MRRILLSIISLAILSAIAIGQAGVEPPCPRISVEPVRSADFSDPILFKAEIGTEIEFYSPTYQWKAHNGKILAGHSTREIEVRIVSFEKNLTVAIEIDGLPSNCPSTASVTMSIDLPPVATLLDMITGTISKVPQRRFDKIIDAADANPNAQIYMVISGSKLNTKASLLTKQSLLINGLVRKPAERDRFKFLISNNTDDRVFIWLVPIGAEAPKQ